MSNGLTNYDASKVQETWENILSGAEPAGPRFKKQEPKVFRKFI